MSRGYVKSLIGVAGASAASPPPSSPKPGSSPSWAKIMVEKVTKNINKKCLSVAKII